MENLENKNTEQEVKTYTQEEVQAMLAQLQAQKETQAV